MQRPRKPSEENGSKFGCLKNNLFVRSAVSGQGIV